jgi:hypothetical protein
MSRPVSHHVVVGLLLWCVAPRTGEAQITVGQIDPSGLGAATRGAPDRLVSVLTLGVDGAVDENNQTILTSALDPSGALDPSITIDPQFRGVQYFSSLHALLSLGKRSDHLSWQVAGGSSVRFYPGLQEVVRARDNLNASVTVPVGTRFRMYGAGFVAYSPYYSLASALLPGGTAGPAVVDPLSSNVQTSVTAPDPATTAVDYSLVRRSAYTSYTTGGFSYRVGQYSTLTVQGGTQRTDFVDATAPSLRGWDARFRYTHQISQGTSVHVGYGRREARFWSSSVNAPVLLEDLDIGIDHSRAWSLTRNTTLRIAPGVAVTKDAGGTRRFNVIAAASLEHLMRRTGSMGVRYDRQTGLVGGLVHPIFTDTFSGHYTENLSRRLAFDATAEYLRGQVGATSTSANDYRSYDAQVRLSYGFTTNMFLHGDYLLYSHHFGSDVQLLGSIAAVQRRQSVRVGLTLRLPLLNGRP